jgi:uncharacterized DUF497 family protein
MKTSFDPDKNRLNVIKHGISFDDVAEFVWETAVVSKDQRNDYGEERRVALGFIENRLHVLVYTVRIDCLRIISLRKANKREQKIYEQCK